MLAIHYRSASQLSLQLIQMLLDSELPDSEYNMACASNVDPAGLSL